MTGANTTFHTGLTSSCASYHFEVLDSLRQLIQVLQCHAQQIVRLHLPPESELVIQTCVTTMQSCLVGHAK